MTKLMNTITNSDDTIDVGDVIARVEELRNERDSLDEDEEHDEDDELAFEDEEHDEDDKEELALLESLLSDLEGKGGDEQWEGAWYPSTLIRDSYFTEAMRDLVEDIGDMPNGLPSYLVIDWEATADNLRVDYSSVEFDGETYWYR